MARLPPRTRLSVEPAACLNCGAALAGAYCGACGQSARTERLRFPQMLRDLTHGVLSADSKILRTFGALARRPGPFIREYLLGRRVEYAGPFGYYLLVMAFNVALSALLAEAGAVPAEPDPDSFWEENFVALQLGLAFAVVMLPLAAVRRLVYRAAGFSVAEHFAFLLFVLAQSLLVLRVVDVAVLLMGGSLVGDPEGLVWLGIFVVYLLWAGRSLVPETWWKALLKVLGACALIFLALGVGGALVQWALGSR
ncbi:MAG TPA: DUF3667 domain-containing protein [Longimicrobiaceae bacterium]|nr:DUF3667 domain-containing protein [Longimicrobiaceae bacterium]